MRSRYVLLRTCSGSVLRSDQLSDGVAPEPELLCERLIDDGDPGGIQGVRIRELASCNERDAECREVARADFVIVGVAVGVGSGPEPLNGDVLLAVAARQNRHVRYCHGRDAPRCAKFVFEALEEDPG